jgi:hypothetical protein
MSADIKSFLWDVPFEIRHGLRLMVTDFLDFLCYTLTNVMNNVVLDFSQKKNFF